eukprot:5167734-Ditylum_brightwellii.AAC.2
MGELDERVFQQVIAEVEDYLGCQAKLGWRWRRAKQESKKGNCKVLYHRDSRSYNPATCVKMAIQLLYVVLVQQDAHHWVEVVQIVDAMAHSAQGVVIVAGLQKVCHDPVIESQ